MLLASVFPCGSSSVSSVSHCVVASTVGAVEEITTSGILITTLQPSLHTRTQEVIRRGHTSQNNPQRMSTVVATQGVHVSSEVTLSATELGAQTGQVVGSISSQLTITGQCETTPPRRDSDDYSDEIPLKKKIGIWVASLVFGSLPVAMTVIGIIDYNLCPGDASLGLYLVTQGATSVLIPILCSMWYCCQCVPKYFLLACCCFIGLFNIGWGVRGSLWIFKSNCTDSMLYKHAFGFTIPMWILFCILALIGWWNRHDVVEVLVRVRTY